jgi:hypothetical protein
VNSGVQRDFSEFRDERAGRGEKFVCERKKKLIIKFRFRLAYAAEAQVCTRIFIQQQHPKSVMQVNEGQHLSTPRLRPLSIAAARER